jgi:hypothetical protein
MANDLSLAERVIHSTVRIECVRRDRRVSTGTGFFCGLLQKAGYYAPVLVTSRQVVAGAQRGRLIPTPAELAEVPAWEDVVVVGYPNGVWDSVNNRPILRKGITATDPNVDYQGRAEFLVDLAWLPGSSGSPVFLWNIGSYATRAGELRMGSRVKLVGIFSSGPARRTISEATLFGEPTGQQEFALPTASSDFGTVIKARKLMELEPILAAIAARGQQRWRW